MFRETIKDRFQKIFEISEVTFDMPGDSKEQDTLFVDIESSRNTIKKGREYSIVRGSLAMYARSDKLPFGFFSKKINKADRELTKQFLFYAMDGNERTYQNLVERRCNFIFLYSNAYDPEGGELTSVDLQGTTP